MQVFGSPAHILTISFYYIYKWVWESWMGLAPDVV